MTLPRLALMATLSACISVPSAAACVAGPDGALSASYDVSYTADGGQTQSQTWRLQRLPQRLS